jgi:CheY-like chemotaxis protein
MQLIDDTIGDASALVIDSNHSSRSLMSAQLRELGVSTIRQAARIRDARMILEHNSYDIVLCDYHFDGSEMSGQDLLDELRREQLLPYSTVFVMVTGEASYAKVAEAAEAALDAYLVKPYTSGSLADRLMHARQRKRILKGIFEAIEAQDFEQAARLCVERFKSRAQYWLYAARIGAELLMRLNRFDEARMLYDAIIAARTMPWARLGVARTELATGNGAAARRTLETLIGDLPDFADSYDMMGRVQLEQGELGAALKTYRTASNLTPGCLLRQQRCGTLAFYAGQREEALKLLERTVASGLRSKLFDYMSLVLIALIRFDAKDNKGIRHVQESMQREQERQPKSVRLQRFARVVQGLRLLQERRLSDALELGRKLGKESDEEDFDLEAASLSVALWIRIYNLGASFDDMMPTITRLGLRYCTSKASTEVLVAMAEAHEAAAAELQSCHARIFGIAETAMRHSMRGTPLVAVELLIQQGEQTRNAKLIDMASLVLKRHAEKIENAQALSDQIVELQNRYVLPLGSSISRSNRAAGGLALRGA